MMKKSNSNTLRTKNIEYDIKSVIVVLSSDIDLVNEVLGVMVSFTGMLDSLIVLNDDTARDIKSVTENDSTKVLNDVNLRSNISVIFCASSTMDLENIASLSTRSNISGKKSSTISLNAINDAFTVSETRKLSRISRT